MGELFPRSLQGRGWNGLVYGLPGARALLTFLIRHVLALSSAAWTFQGRGGSRYRLEPGAAGISASCPPRGRDLVPGAQAPAGALTLPIWGAGVGEGAQKGPPLPVCDRQPPDISAKPVLSPRPCHPIHSRGD